MNQTSTAPISKARLVEQSIMAVFMLWMIAMFIVPAARPWNWIGSTKKAEITKMDARNIAIEQIRTREKPGKVVGPHDEKISKTPDVWFVAMRYKRDEAKRHAVVGIHPDGTIESVRIINDTSK